MNKEQKQTIKLVIVEKMAAVEKKIAGLADLSKPVAPDNAIGRLTRMEAINSRSINEAALVKAKQTLKDLERALGLIDDPDFGICGHCEEQISFKRLLILPEAVLCVSCAEKITRV